ncbi:POU domain class 2-associating factor 2 [Serinus canaria]|uniref:POU domain class 2-associating factor 2 n=1 Tax=Serinus canaria TaxID=9135 RepID=UPI0021CD14FA|nr:POU domain class 2-associating factor 2 [Serinus canaria]
MAGLLQGRPGLPTPPGTRGLRAERRRHRRPAARLYPLLCALPELCIRSVPADFGKRVYQGVRVKHTVKDLLAEKRSRQSSGSRFSGSTSTAQSPFGQIPGSPPMSGYYGVRRSFPAELDFHGTKQFVSDAYPSPLGSRPFSCDSSVPQGHPARLEPYLSEFGDHRAAAPPLPAPTSSFFSAPAVPPLLPSFPSDTGHFLLVSASPWLCPQGRLTPSKCGVQSGGLREPWEQPSPESLGQPDSACSEPLQALPASSSCLSLPEPGAASPFRGSDTHYSPSYAATSPYSLSPLVASEPSRMSHLCPEPPLEPPHLPEHSAWAKEDGSALWGTYEGRRTY